MAVKFRSRQDLDRKIATISTIKITNANDAAKVYPHLVNLMQQIQRIVQSNARAEVFRRTIKSKPASQPAQVAEPKVVEIEKRPEEPSADNPFDEKLDTETAQKAKADLVKASREKKGDIKIKDKIELVDLEEKPESASKDTKKNTKKKK